MPFAVTADGTTLEPVAIAFPAADVTDAVEKGDAALQTINSQLVSIVDRMVCIVNAHANQPTHIGNKMVELADEAVPVLARVGRARR